MTAPRIPRRDPDNWPVVGLLLTLTPGLAAVTAFVVLVVAR